MDIDLADLPDNVETLQRMVRTLATERANLTEARAEIERELWWLHAREANFKARELLQHAIELDPDFAPAHAFLAAAHINDYVSQWGASPSQSLEKAHEVVMRAAALDDKYPYTYWGMTFVNLWMRRYDDAVRAAERSISLNPNFAEGHNALGVILHYVGRSAEAFGCFDRAMALDPLCPGMWLHFQAQAAFQLGRYETAAALLKRRIVGNPDTDASRVLLAARFSYGKQQAMQVYRIWDFRRPADRAKQNGVKRPKHLKFVLRHHPAVFKIVIA
jgi:tetratricopeptide (TPR) repeat protein